MPRIPFHSEPMPKRILCLLVDGFEEIETVTPIDLLRRAGAEVVMASTMDQLLLTGRSGIMLQADCHLSEVQPETFDVLLIPGGPGVSALRCDHRVADLVKKFIDSGRKVAAICAAPLVLHDAGVLNGEVFTAHRSTWDTLPEADRTAAVVTSGLLVTSQGAGTAIPFALTLISQLFGPDMADQVATSIHFPSA